TSFLPPPRSDERRSSRQVGERRAEAVQAKGVRLLCVLSRRGLDWADPFPAIVGRRIERGRRMGVPVGVGKCYVTEIGQVRRVLEIKDTMVKYVSRGKTAHGRSWGALTP